MGQLVDEASVLHVAMEVVGPGHGVVDQQTKQLFTLCFFNSVSSYSDA